MSSFAIQIRAATPDVPTDEELESLLYQVYVNAGFTGKELAETSLAADNVRLRGDLFVALAGSNSQLVGTAILVGPNSTACRIATRDSDTELHLLAVHPEFRRRRIGRSLVAAVLSRAKNQGHSRVMLWTQPSMKEAHLLYQSFGFARLPELDFRSHGRHFWVMQTKLD